MSSGTEFLESVRRGDWQTARALLRSGVVDLSLPTPGPSPVQWLMEIDAPTDVVMEFARAIAKSGAVDPNNLGLLMACLELIPTRAHASSTFRALLDTGLSANVIVSGGATLLQKAIELNRVDEVDALLRHGADPYQNNIFGMESTNNLEEALRADNAAGRLALAYWKMAPR